MNNLGPLMTNAVGLKFVPPSAALRERKFKEGASTQDENKEDDEPEARPSRTRHMSTILRAVAPPMKMTEQTQFNLGKVHYQLAVSVKIVFFEI